MIQNPNPTIYDTHDDYADVDIEARTRDESNPDIDDKFDALESNKTTTRLILCILLSFFDLQHYYHEFILYCFSFCLRSLFRSLFSL
jgi:hypothetical protein